MILLNPVDTVISKEILPGVVDQEN